MARTLFVIALVVLSVIGSVTAAWICAQKSLQSDPQPLTDADVSTWRETQLPGWPETPEVRVDATATGYSYRAISGTMFFLDEDARAGPSRGWCKGILKEWRAGWPLACVRCRAWATLGNGVPSSHPFAPGTRWRGVFFVPGTELLKDLQQNQLPIQPIPSGLLIDSALIFSILSSLAFIPILARRFARMRTGHCPGCAYPAGASSICSECGEPLPSRVLAAAAARRGPPEPMAVSPPGRP